MILLLAACLLAAPAARPAPAGIAWQKSFDTAVAKAKANGVPIMVDFWAEWCGPCHMLDRDTYRDPTVVSLSRRFVSVKINVEGSKEELDLASRFLVDSLPTIAFLSPSGRQLWRINGYASSEEFPPMIDEALKIGSRVIAWETALAKNPKDVAALRGLGLHQFAELQQTARSNDSGLIPKFMLEDAGKLLGEAMEADKDEKAADRKRVRRVLGLVRGAEGNVAETEAMLKAALAIKPADPAEDADTQASLGELYIHQGKKELAAKTFRMVAKEYPGTRGATRAAQQLERLGARP